MIIEGRMISPGKAKGEVVKVDEPLSFLGGVNGSTGEIAVGKGGNVAGRILVFPKGKGSTVGSFVMYDLMVHGVQPAAVINETAETIVATGAVISSIPMVDRIPSIDIFRDGDIAEVDADSGRVSIEGLEMVEVVSNALYRDGKVLLLHRPDDDDSFPGKWSLVAGKVEKGEEPAQASVREIEEETGIKVSSPSVTLDPIYTREGSTVWKVHPMLFLTDSEPVLNDENDAYRWVDPSEISDDDTVTRTRDVVSRMVQRLRSHRTEGFQESVARRLGVGTGPALHPLPVLRYRPVGVVGVGEEPQLHVKAVAVPSEVDLVRLVGLESELQAVEEREIPVQALVKGVAEHPGLLRQRVVPGLQDVVSHALRGILHDPMMVAGAKNVYIRYPMAKACQKISGATSRSPSGMTGARSWSR